MRSFKSGRFEELYEKASGGHGSTLITIRNDDWMCFARAIVVAKARYEYTILNKISKSEYKNILKVISP